MARAGVFQSEDADESWTRATEFAQTLPDDMQGVFLSIARAAQQGAPCPSDAEVAKVYGTQSLGRARRLLGYMEARSIIVTRTDLRGRRSVSLPQLGWATAASDGRDPLAGSAKL